jgi:imidazole glycerol-phosphate synthase subunit HisH
LLAIIDYGMGNIRSVQNAFELLGVKTILTKNKKELSDSDGIILPGVGAFQDGMKNLHKDNLIDFLTEMVIDKKKPYLGICLGLEFLAEKSFENGEHDGFGWIKGEIKKITPDSSSYKIPHMGWNDTQIISSGGLLSELDDASFYFLHSYYFQVDELEKSCITSICDYGGIPITATLQKNNIFATQFHPEKSQLSGLKLLKNFLDIVDV